MSTVAESAPGGAWRSAAQLIARWLDRRERVDVLLDTLPSGLAPAERARCQHLVLGVIRHFGRIDAALARLVPHPPRFVTRAVLFVAGFELIEAAGNAATAEGQAAKIVHHAVEQTKTLASPAEARLVNAVVRKLKPLLSGPAPAAGAAAAELAEYFSHPEWLVRSWLAQFGPDATRALLEWNQKPAPVYARWRATAEKPPEWLKPTPWAGFFEIESGRWAAVEPLLKAGQIYLQDPATRLPVEVLAPQENETLLDLCAAPGGKALLMADAMKAGRLVAVDLPTSRIDRLKENLSRAGAVTVALVQGDVLAKFEALLREHELPPVYDGVLIDVPCSNTGVMRHRVDVKWRLQEGDFKKHPQQQLSMLHVAARLVRPGGRLVYSTCSIDTEENEHVVRSFLASRAGGPYTLESTVLSFPWVQGHDGGASFLLRRST
ncbi:RsmB/NOP family class I SAM-dependent RNA methyltransferase [Opitutus sp. ER46]|uniref:RsmB/NOP family class I SAM-dependent RNA methyltransferase n=1 Tax=Opitutus sp. ER46 TaxID=2161864 RepID=UPI000D319C55|nr:RsmB/NOP family class I SAM-dependent RNA methyltransferase [Opitutus sp. ER46]PTX92558.1 RNA methyltransferase [Opitutus sp. ER46]